MENKVVVADTDSDVKHGFEEGGKSNKAHLQAMPYRGSATDSKVVQQSTTVVDVRRAEILCISWMLQHGHKLYLIRNEQIHTRPCMISSPKLPSPYNRHLHHRLHPVCQLSMIKYRSRNTKR